MKVSAFAHGNIHNEDENGFEINDIRIEYIDTSEPYDNQFIEVSDFELILEAMNDYGSIPTGNWYAFDAEKIYETDEDGHPYQYFILTNHKNINFKLVDQ